MVDIETLENFVRNNIQWLGHGGFLIKVEGKTIAIDPFEIQTDEKADLILVSHSHYDHCSPPDIEKLRTSHTVIVTESSSAPKIQGSSSIMQAGDTLNIEDITIEAVPAYNINKKFHTKSEGWLGFILTINGIRIYHAGDTDLIEEMNDICADIALLPVSGTYVMTAEDAVEAAKRIKPHIAIPMHYGAIVGDADDAARFAKGSAGICKVIVLT